MSATPLWNIYMFDGSSLNNPMTISGAEAASVDAALSVAAKVYGSPAYLSTGLRDAAYAPAPAMPAPVQGMRCTVSGVPYTYVNSTRGWVLDANILPMVQTAQSSSPTIQAVTWTSASTTTSVTDTNGGNGLTAVSRGIQTAVAGYFKCEASVQWAPGVNGRQFVTVSTSAAIANVETRRTLCPDVATTGRDGSITMEVSANANDVISVYVFTSITSGLAKASLRVRQIA